MHLSRISPIGAFVALSLALPLSPASPARGQPIESILSPKSDQTRQTRAKQERDDADCRRWATLHTGFDPKKTPAPEPARPTDRRMNLAPGRSHAMLDGERRDEQRRRDHEMARDRRRALDAADLEDRRVRYDREVKTCLEGRQQSSTKQDLIPGSAVEPGKY